MAGKSYPQQEPTNSGPALKPEERHRMVAESAYYRAERRRFRDGEPGQDWLEAEAEIDQMLVAEKDEA